MRNEKRIVFRCDAGMRYGLGHLSRCYTLSNEFVSYSIQFVIKTDEKSVIDNFFLSKSKSVDYLIIDQNYSEDKEIKLILEYFQKSCKLLVLDHYNITSSFQKKLISNKIKWLQFDSHGKIDLYADWVLHGSPGATDEIYHPLVKRESTKLLLGPRFSIVKNEVVQLRSETKTRERINSILICFGGGDDKGLTLNVLRGLSVKDNHNIEIKVAVSPNNYQFKEIKNELDFFTKARLIAQSELTMEMSLSDLCIIAPGMISYEAACLGLPMLLITFASNQEINALGWSENLCAVHIGNNETLDVNLLNRTISDLKVNTDLLTRLSMNCYDTVDGSGAFRAKNIIEEF